MSTMKDVPGSILLTEFIAESIVERFSVTSKFRNDFKRDTRSLKKELTYGCDER